MANDAFPAEAHEGALDRLTAIAQQQDALINTSIRVPLSDQSANLVLPSKANRINGFVSFDANGDIGINALSNIDFFNLDFLNIDKINIDDFTIKINDAGNTAGNTTLRLSGYTINDFVEVFNSAFRVQPSVSSSGNVEIGHDLSLIHI